MEGAMTRVAPGFRAGASDVSAPRRQDEFGGLIAFYRQRRGLSQGQLAHAARLSRTYIYHLETGQRQAPSARVARSILRALEVHGDDRRRLAGEFAQLTGLPMEDEAEELDLLDQRELASLLVHHMAFPAHSLDRLWNVSAWNDPAMRLFELDPEALGTHHRNLLAVVFDTAYRARFRPWETLARRLLADFKHNTRSVTYLPEYRDLCRSLRPLPHFPPLAAPSPPTPPPPAPSFIFQMRHSRLRPLSPRTTVTLFTGASAYSLVTHLPRGH